MTGGGILVSVGVLRVTGMGPGQGETMAIGVKMQNQLEELLSSGAALEVSARGKMANQLVDLAVCAKRGGSHLTIKDIGLLMQNQLIDIARAGSGHVTFKD